MDPTTPMGRKIRCDGCGLEILEEKAIASVWDEETLYFCSEACEQKQKVLDQVEPPEENER